MLSPFFLASLAGCAATIGTPDEPGAANTSQALVDGEPAAVRTFNGSTSRVTVPHVAAFNFGSGNFAIEARVKFAGALPSYEPIVSQRTGYSDGFLFAIYSNTLLIQMNGVPNYESAALPNLNDGKYHHLAVTRNGTTLSFYVDGAALGTATSARSLNTTGPLYIGYDAVDHAGFAGAFNEVRLWNIGQSASYMASVGAPGGVDVPVTTAGIVGSWQINGTESQWVRDLSATGANGYLGSDPSRWDSADPSLNVPQSIALSAASISNPNARIAAGGTAVPDSCGSILVNGTMDQFSMSSYSSLSQASFNFFCSNQEKELKLADAASGALKLPIDGINVDLSASNTSSADWTTVNNFCSGSSSNMTDDQAKAWLYSVADPTIVNAWLKCESLYAEPNVLKGSYSVSTDGATITLNLSENIIVNGQPNAVITDAFVTNASCTGAVVTSGTTVPAGQGINATCTRVGNSPVTVVVTTTQGAYDFEIAGTGVVATAWVSAAIPSTGQVTNQVCQTGSVTYRTCLFGLCSDTTVGPWSISLDTGYTAWENVSLTDTSGYGNISNQRWWYSNNNQTINAQFTRSGNHSASMNLCGTEYYNQTTYTEYQNTAAIPIYANLPFEVRVSAGYVGPQLHVQMNNGAVYSQDLTVATYTAPLVKNQVLTSDPIMTTYSVTLSQ